MPDPLRRRWLAAHEAAVPWSPPQADTLVLVPHPDDELLLFGGLIARQIDSGCEVTVLAATDGEAAYASAEAQTLASLRRREQSEALRTLTGGPSVEIVRLGLPDGALAEHADELVDAIRHHAQTKPFVAAPWTMDHHCDHEALGHAAIRAVSNTDVALVFGLFWAWHHRFPEDLSAPLLKLALPPAVLRRKRAALCCHHTQLQWPGEDPILTRAALEPIRWPAEYYLAHELDGCGR